MATEHQVSTIDRTPHSQFKQKGGLLREGFLSQEYFPLHILIHKGSHLNIAIAIIQRMPVFRFPQVNLAYLTQPQLTLAVRVHHDSKYGLGLMKLRYEA